MNFIIYFLPKPGGASIREAASIRIDTERTYLFFQPAEIFTQSDRIPDLQSDTSLIKIKSGKWNVANFIVKEKYDKFNLDLLYKSTFTPCEWEHESDIVHEWVVLFSIQFFTLSDAKNHLCIHGVISLEIQNFRGMTFWLWLSTYRVTTICVSSYPISDKFSPGNVQFDINGVFFFCIYQAPESIRIITQSPC